MSLTLPQKLSLKLRKVKTWSNVLQLTSTRTIPLQVYQTLEPSMFYYTMLPHPTHRKSPCNEVCANICTHHWECKNQTIQALKQFNVRQTAFTYKAVMCCRCYDSTNRESQSLHPHRFSRAQKKVEDDICKTYKTTDQWPQETILRSCKWKNPIWLTNTHTHKFTHSLLSKVWITIKKKSREWGSAKIFDRSQTKSRRIPRCSVFCWKDFFKKVVDVVGLELFGPITARSSTLVS